MRRASETRAFDGGPLDERDTATEMVAASMVDITTFRDQQFDYIDQLDAAMKDAARRGAVAEANLLRADLGDAQVATADDWSVLKRQLDRDLDGAVMVRTASMGRAAPGRRH
jgi:hypothetical protein